MHDHIASTIAVLQILYTVHNYGFCEAPIISSPHAGLHGVYMCSKSTSSCALLSFCMFTGSKHRICQGNDGKLICMCCVCLCVCVFVCVCVCVYVCVCVCVCTTYSFSMSI